MLVWNGAGNHAKLTSLQASLLIVIPGIKQDTKSSISIQPQVARKHNACSVITCSHLPLEDLHHLEECPLQLARFVNIL